MNLTLTEAERERIADASVYGDVWSIIDLTLAALAEKAKPKVDPFFAAVMQQSLPPELEACRAHFGIAHLETVLREGMAIAIAAGLVVPVEGGR